MFLLEGCKQRARNAFFCFACGGEFHWGGVQMFKSATEVSRMRKIFARFDFISFFSLFQMVEMVCLHVISLMEALQECNSTIFVKVHHYTTFQKKLQIRRPQDESQQSFFFSSFLS